MKKLFIILVLTLFVVTPSWAADTKLSALTALEATPAGTDQIYINDGGTSKRITVDYLFQYFEDGNVSISMPINLTEDGGAMTVFNQSVSADPAAGTAEGYAFLIDSVAVAYVYALADSSGGVTHAGLISRPGWVDVPTTETTLTEVQCMAKFVTNQGASGEVDVFLPAVSYYQEVDFVVTEAAVFEINPPSGELFTLDTVALHADDVVDSDTAIGSRLKAWRQQIADGSWQWVLVTITGTWADSAASD